MNTWKIIFATVVIFGAGVVTGGLLVHYSNESQPQLIQKVAETIHPTAQATNGVRDLKWPSPPLMGPLRKDFVDRLQRELKINSAQRENIEKIISEGQEQTKVIWEAIAPDMHQTIVETKNKIRAELTPEQQAKFEELFKTKPHSPPKASTATSNAAPAVLTNSPAVK